MKILELKVIETKMKNHQRDTTADFQWQKKISELKARSTEIIQLEKQREKD